MSLLGYKDREPHYFHCAIRLQDQRHFTFVNIVTRVPRLAVFTLSVQSASPSTGSLRYPSRLANVSTFTSVNGRIAAHLQESRHAATTSSFDRFGIPLLAFADRFGCFSHGRRRPHRKLVERQSCLEHARRSRHGRDAQSHRGDQTYSG